MNAPVNETASRRRIRLPIGPASPAAGTLKIYRPAPPGRAVGKGLEGVIQVLRETARQPLSPELQAEVAGLARLIPSLHRPENRRFIVLAEVAADALCAPTPNLALATSMRQAIEVRAKAPRVIRWIRGGGSPSTRVILGLGSMLAFAGALIALTTIVARLLPPRAWTTILGMDAEMLLLVALAGALGSVVSIMVRLRDFERGGEADPSIMFLTGFFKPVVGVSFALFVYVVFNAGVLPLAVESAKSLYFFAALAFVSGFSERFATDVVARTEQAANTP